MCGIFLAPTLCLSPGIRAGLSFYTWKWCQAGDEPSRGCNPALCCGFLGSEDILLIKMFIELLEILTRQCSKSGISTRCLNLYYKGNRETGSSADRPQRNASQKRWQHQEKGRRWKWQWCHYLELWEISPGKDPSILLPREIGGWLVDT